MATFVLVSQIARRLAQTRDTDGGRDGTRTRDLHHVKVAL